MSQTPQTWKDLLQYCRTDRQREVVEACAKHGSASKAARALGIHKSSAQENVNRVKAYAARK